MAAKKEQVYLAFDLGASSGRAILGRVGGDGQIRIEEVHRFPNGPVTTADGVFWERNSLNDQKPQKEPKTFHSKTLELFNA